MALTDTEKTKKTWLDVRCKDWKENRKKWSYAMDHYNSNEALKKALEHANRLRQYAGNEWEVRSFEDGDASVERVSPNIDLNERYGGGGLYENYLPMKPREQVLPYLDRVQTTDTVDHMYRIINTVVGLMASAESDANRTWQEERAELGLRNHSTGDVAQRLKKDADGNRTSWRDKWEDVLRYLLIFDKAYIAVTGANPDARVQFLDPRNVVNKRYRDGRLVEMLVRNQRTVQAPLKEGRGQQQQEIYIHYDLNGIQRFRKVETGDGEVTTEAVTEKQEYTFFESDNTETRRLPVVEVSHGLPMDFGGRLAQRTNTIFQKVSERDHAQRTMQQNLVSADVTDDAFRNLRRVMMQNGNVVQGDVDFANPSKEPVESANEVIEEKVNNLYKDFFLSYEDSAAEKTATQIRQDFQTGLESLLNTLATTLDRAETEVMQLVEQVYFPDQPRVWGQTSVTRTTDFNARDNKEDAKLILERMFPVEGPDLSPEIRARLTAKVLDIFGVDYDDTELTDAASGAQRQQVREELQGQAFDDNIG